MCSGLDAENQNATKVISQDIRLARSVESSNANQLVLRSLGETISYTFDAANHTLTRDASSKTENLLTRVDSLAFSLLRPDPFRADGGLIPANLSNARAVACRWSCSWKLAGAKLDSGEIRLAAVLMRNRHSRIAGLAQY
jgi:hypothetical protein